MSKSSVGLVADFTRAADALDEMSVALGEAVRAAEESMPPVSEFKFTLDQLVEMVGGDAVVKLIAIGGAQLMTFEDEYDVSLFEDTEVASLQALLGE